MKSSDFDYNLPEERIAKYPPKKRGDTRLLLLNCDNSLVKPSDKKYADLADLIPSNAVIVLNDTKVLRARFFAKYDKTGKECEILYLNNISWHDDHNSYWETLIGGAKKLQEGDILRIGEYSCKFLQRNAEHATNILEIDPKIEKEIFNKYGHVPLPPYLKRSDEASDKKRYNTIFAKIDGSVAAPTASLNITEELLSKLKNNGVEIAYVTLDVGWGTFAPVKTDKVQDFKIHSEKFSLNEENADIINCAIRKGRPVIAFGTTATRVLESVAVYDDREDKYIVKAKKGYTDIFIYPGYNWKVITGLVTNFHAPKSSLLMLVSSFLGHLLGNQEIGLDEVKKEYQYAMDQRYSFLSYGDSMFINKKIINYGKQIS